MNAIDTIKTELARALDDSFTLAGVSPDHATSIVQGFTTGYLQHSPRALTEAKAEASKPKKRKRSMIFGAQQPSLFN